MRIMVNLMHNNKERVSVYRVSDFGQDRMSSINSSGFLCRNKSSDSRE